MAHENKTTANDSIPAAKKNDGADPDSKFIYENADGLTIEPSDDPDAEEFYLG